MRQPAALPVPGWARLPGAVDGDGSLVLCAAGQVGRLSPWKTVKRYPFYQRLNL